MIPQPIHETLRRLYADHAAKLLHDYSTVLSRAGLDAVALHSGSLKKKTEFDDQYWPLRVIPHFAHWLPLAEPDCAVIVRSGQKPRLVRPRATSFWEKPPAPEGDYFFDAFEVIEVDRPEDARAHLGTGKVAYVGEDYARAHDWGVPPELVAPPALVKALDALRTTKTPYEIACIAEANRRASLGHEAVRKAFLEGDASELELHLVFLGATLQDDPETPYKNIVALGSNAATLHHVSYGRSRTGRSVESLLLDAGATFQGYCSDITRTWVRGVRDGGATAAAFSSLVSGMEAMQQRLCAAVRIGLPYEELHDESHRQTAALLRDVGLVRASAEEAVANGITRAFFPHGLGHSLGLQTHDVGCAVIQPKPENPFLRNTSIIAEGQVFTIEPGVYFIDSLLATLRGGEHASGIDWKLVDALAELGGVRIEDDLLVKGGADARTNAARNFTREVLPA